MIPKRVQSDLKRSEAQCLEVFEKYFLFFGPTCNFKGRKIKCTVNLPQTSLILAKFEILNFCPIIPKLV